MSPVAGYIVQSVVTLLAFALLAVVVVYAGRRLGFGRTTGPLELVGRLPLDGRRAVYLVRVAKVVYVVGSSEAGLTRLGELDAGAVPPAAPGAPGPSFDDVLRRLVRPDRSDRAPLDPQSPFPPGGGEGRNG